MILFTPLDDVSEDSQLSSKARIQHVVPHLKDDPAEDGGIHFELQRDLFAGLLFESGKDASLLLFAEAYGSQELAANNCWNRMRGILQSLRVLLIKELAERFGNLFKKRETFLFCQQRAEIFYHGVNVKLVENL